MRCVVSCLYIPVLSRTGCITAFFQNPRFRWYIATVMEEGSIQEKKSRSETPGPDAEDLRAISEALTGNTDAFRIIVEHHGAMVYRLARSFLGSREEAEEASQEVFFKVFRSLRSFSLEKPFLPWLSAVAMNHLRSHYARVRRIDERIVREGEEIRATAAQSDPQVIVQTSEARHEVRKAIASLAPGIREALCLYYLEGMSVSQVSAVLGIGSENVKSRLLRGRKKLREFLDPDATR